MVHATAKDQTSQFDFRCADWISWETIRSRPQAAMVFHSLDPPHFYGKNFCGNPWRLR